MQKISNLNKLLSLSILSIFVIMTFNVCNISLVNNDRVWIETDSRVDDSSTEPVRPHGDN